MLTLAHPWLLLLLPLPLLARWLAPPHREPRQALVVPFLERIAAHSGQTPSAGAVVMRGSWWRMGSLLIVWACVILALARPQVIEQAITKQIPVRDLLLAVDLSGSMETQDFKNAAGKTVDRLAAVKEVLDDFLAKRQGDRVGLIFFGTAPFVQAPFTEDLHVCRELLDEAQVRMAGPQTAFGDALGLAINTFERSKMKSRVLIALTDGNDTASKVPPAKAAEIAKDKGIVIHTVAVGDPQAAGEEALDVEALKTVAATTGGTFAHAGDRAQLESIYRKLDALETHQAETVSHRPRRDVYWWPLALALAVSALLHALRLLSAGHGNKPPATPADTGARETPRAPAESASQKPPAREEVTA
ncbi:MAG: VWA domain-containing protein [Verrucomicrobiota bacterium]